MARACEICGSRKWRRDAITGGARCEEGHLRQGYRAETLVVDQGASNFHMIKRRKGTGGPRRNKRKEEGRANPEFYHGFEAEYLRIQALQLLLRLQLQALSKLWSLPDVYEAIVRDLWAYQLSMSTLPTLPEQYDRSRTQSPLPTTQKPHIDADMIDEDGDQGGSASDSGSEKHGSGSESGSGSVSESDSVDKGEVDPEILERIDESDKEEDPDQIDQAGVGGVKQSGDVKWKRKKQLKIFDTIITLVVGLRILRIPIMTADVENLVNQNEIPYIDFGHTTYIPAGMKKRMNRDVMIALSPLRSPSPAMIHRSCRIFARILNRKHGIQVPETNVHPVAWRIISALGATTYAQVTKLMAILDLNMSLLEREVGTISRRIRSRLKLDPDDSASGDEVGNDVDVERVEEKMQSYEKALLYLDVVAPEVAVVASWLIVTKMMYGLDGSPREALLSTDPAIGLPIGVTCVKELESRLDSGALRGKRADLEKHDFTKLDDDEMDAFLTRCQEVLLDHREEPSDVGPFPLAPPTDIIPPVIPPNSWISYHSTVDRIDHRPSSPISKATNNKSLPLMPGERVRSYDSSDPLVLNDLPTDFEVVLNAACEVIGWDRRDVLRVLEGFERRLERMRPKNEYVPRVQQEIQVENESELEHRIVGGHAGVRNGTSRTPRRPTMVRRGSSAVSRSRPTSRVGSEADDSDYVDVDQVQRQGFDRDRGRDDNQGRKRSGLARTRSVSQTRERPISKSRRGSIASTIVAPGGSGNGNTSPAGRGTLSRETSLTRLGAGSAGRRSRETSMSRSGSRNGSRTRTARGVGAGTGAGLVTSGSRSRLKSSQSFG
ncbi:hypothetical protein IAU59_005994 [Kwoniella sp. CBS 9459]